MRKFSKFAQEASIFPLKNIFYQNALCNKGGGQKIGWGIRESCSLEND